MAAYNIQIHRNVGRPTKIEQALEHWAYDVAQWCQNYMLENDRIATGDSINSFEIMVDKNQVILYTADSVGYALQGRGAGAFPDVAEIEKWILAKPVEAYPDENGRIPTLGQLVFLISRKIARDGTDPPKLQPQNLSVVVATKGIKYQKLIGEEHADQVLKEFTGTFKRSRAYQNK